MDPRNFLLNTDYPMDKVIYLNSGSHSMTGGGGSIKQFAHNLGFTPLIIGTWSFNSNFLTSREGGMFTAEGTDPTTAYTTFSANATDITIDCFNPGATATIYYRIYGFMPSDVNADVAFTASLAENFQFNTDFNYTKLFSSSVASAGTSTITHNLGYRPQVLTWIEDSTIYGTTAIVDSGFVKATTTTVVIISPTKSVHYRIYADGQL